MCGLGLGLGLELESMLLYCDIGRLHFFSIDRNIFDHRIKIGFSYQEMPRARNPDTSLSDLLGCGM